MYSELLRLQQQRELEAALAQSCQLREPTGCRQVTPEEDDEPG